MLHLHHPLKRGLIALALTLAVSAAAHAGDETTIRVRTAAGQIEKVTVDDIGAIAVGEGRALTTAAGNYAFLRREAENYVLEVAGERFELSGFTGETSEMLAAHHAAHGAKDHDGHERHVVIRHKTDEQVESKGEKRKIVRVLERDGSEDITELEGEIELALADGEGARVMVTRKVTKEQ